MSTSFGSWFASYFPNFPSVHSSIEMKLWGGGKKVINLLLQYSDLICGVDSDAVLAIGRSKAEKHSSRSWGGAMIGIRMCFDALLMEIIVSVGSGGILSSLWGRLNGDVLSDGAICSLE